MHKVIHSRSGTQQGFTFIELVVVIILIGLMSAVALPRFLEVTDEAQLSSLQGVSGGLATAVAMTHAQWIGEGNSAPAPTDASNKTQVNMDGVIIYLNENGWPANTDSSAESSINGQSNDECLQVWNSVLQSSPPATILTDQRPSNRYFVSVVTIGGNIYCRYEMIINSTESAIPTHYIDYRVSTGEVNPHFPNQ